jgi:hypothetical protein
VNGDYNFRESAENQQLLGGLMAKWVAMTLQMRVQKRENDKTVDKKMERLLLKVLKIINSRQPKNVM